MTTPASKKSKLPGRLGLGVGALVFAGLALFVFAQPTTVSTGPDQVALHYSAGPFSPTRFSDCIGSSSRAWNGPKDRHFKYPSSQRNYVFDAADGDRGPIQFVTKDGIEMSVNGVAAFRLNTQCEALHKFHDLIGNRYLAYMDSDSGNGSSGWLRMLGVYVSKPLETAVDRASQNYTYTQLYLDPAIKAKWERDVLAQLPDLVGRQIDGDEDFFTNFSITLQKPVPPASVKEALENQQAAVAKANARKAEADAQVAAARAQIEVERAEAQKILQRIKVLGRDGYLRQYAIDKGLNPYQPSTSGIITGQQ